MEERGLGSSGAPAAVLKFSGSRFDDEGMPAWALSEIVAFQARLAEVAKAQFRQIHNRIRVPSGFDERISLRLGRVENGSAISFLLRPTSQTEAENDIFEEIFVPDIFDEARDAINGLITSSIENLDLPDIFAQVPVRVIKRFGQSLLEGESLQLGSANDLRQWEALPRYSRETRRNLLLNLTGTYTDRTTLSGVIDNLYFGQQNFAIRADDGRVVPAPYTDEEFRKLIKRAQPIPTTRFQVDGEGEFGADRSLIRFLTVDSLTAADEEILEVDYDRARKALDIASELEEAWDGESGLPMDQTKLRLTRIIVDQMQRQGMPAPYVYPTELGGLQLEWTHGIFAVSLELKPDDHRLLLQSTNTENVTFETHKPGGDVEGLSEALQWLGQRLGVRA
jgi:hypothetical protein